MQIDLLATAHGTSKRIIEEDYSPIDYYDHICRVNTEEAKKDYLHEKLKK
jgi:hypothetical protein